VIEEAYENAQEQETATTLREVETQKRADTEKGRIAHSRAARDESLRMIQERRLRRAA
jgi:hypothetical protein